jgi:bacterial/archaeal transporter family-2 protein
LTRATALTAVLAVGALMAVQSPINAKLGKYTGGVIGAVFVSSCVATLLLAVLLVAYGGGFGQLRGISSAPVVYLSGGFIGAAAILAWAAAVVQLGTAGVIAATVCAQLLVSTLILDRLGLVGLDQIGLTAARVGGVPGDDAMTAR